MDSAERANWIAVLAKAPLPLLEKQLSTLGELPGYSFLRSPEIGLAMVRGRVEGTGQPFNLGEITLTRCVIQLNVSSGGAIAGFGYVSGRSQRHAELAALCDGLMQHPGWQQIVQTQVIDPLAAAAKATRTAAAAQVESTRVNFFTMLRGEG